MNKQTDNNNTQVGKPSGYSTNEYVNGVVELYYTPKYALIEYKNIFAVVRTIDKMGLPPMTGEDGRRWANTIKGSDKFNSVNDYEFKTCDELTDYSYLYNAPTQVGNEVLHTQGEWFIIQVFGGQNFWIKSKLSPPDQIAIVYSTRGISSKEAKANAELIASAPQLKIENKKLSDELGVAYNSIEDLKDINEQEGMKYKKLKAENEKLKADKAKLVESNRELVEVLEKLKETILEGDPEDIAGVILTSAVKALTNAKNI